MDQNLVKGKIVLCVGRNTIGPFLAEAVGVISTDDGPKDKADIFPLPESYVSLPVGNSIYSYIKSSRYAIWIGNPVVKIGMTNLDSLLHFMIFCVGSIISKLQILQESNSNRL